MRHYVTLRLGKRRRGRVSAEQADAIRQYLLMQAFIGMQIDFGYQ